MREIVIKKLREYIRINHQDLSLLLEEENRMEEYVNSSIITIEPLLSQMMAQHGEPGMIERVCMEKLTKPLRPSRLCYVRVLAEQEFPQRFEALRRAGQLFTELSHISAVCLPLFEVFDFSEATKHDRYLRAVIKTAMKAYFEEGDRLAESGWSSPGRQLLPFLNKNR